MRQCTKCKIYKPETEYFIKSKVTGRLHAQCKECYREHRKSYYSAHYNKYRQEYRNRAKIRREKLKLEFRMNMLEYLSDKYCKDCGESDNRVLELDHIDPEQKLFSISQAVRLGYGWSDVIDEIKKCQILCANCHKCRTAQQFNWYKAI
jgi:hypothetical protein